MTEAVTMIANRMEESTRTMQNQMAEIAKGLQIQMDDLRACVFSSNIPGRATSCSDGILNTMRAGYLPPRNEPVDLVSIMSRAMTYARMQEDQQSYMRDREIRNAINYVQENKK